MPTTARVEWWSKGSTFHKHASFDCFQLNSPHKQSSFYLFRWTVIRSEFLFQPISQQSFFKTQTKNKTLLSHYKTVFWNTALFKTQCLNSLLLTPDFNANNPYLQRFYLFTVCTVCIFNWYLFSHTILGSLLWPRTLEGTEPSYRFFTLNTRRYKRNKTALLPSVPTDF